MRLRVNFQSHLVAGLAPGRGTFFSVPSVITSNFVILGMTSFSLLSPNNKKVTKDAMDAKLAAHADRLTAIERDIKHGPTHDDLKAFIRGWTRCARTSRPSADSARQPAQPGAPRHGLCRHHSIRGRSQGSPEPPHFDRGGVRRLRSGRIQALCEGPAPEKDKR